jgi:hypothetical protein
MAKTLKNAGIDTAKTSAQFASKSMGHFPKRLYAQLKDGSFIDFGADKWTPEMNEWLKENGRFKSLSLRAKDGATYTFPFSGYTPELQGWVRDNTATDNPMPKPMKAVRLKAAKQAEREAVAANKRGAGVEFKEGIAKTAENIGSATITAGKAGVGVVKSVASGMAMEPALKAQGLTPEERVAAAGEIKRAIDKSVAEKIYKPLETVRETAFPAADKYTQTTEGVLGAVSPLTAIDAFSYGMAKAPYGKKLETGMELAKIDYKKKYSIATPEEEAIPTSRFEAKPTAGNFALDVITSPTTLLAVAGGVVPLLVTKLAPASKAASIVRAGQELLTSDIGMLAKPFRGVDLGVEEATSLLGGASSKTARGITESFLPSESEASPFATAERSVEATNRLNAEYEDTSFMLEAERAKLTMIRNGRERELDRFNNERLYPAKEEYDKARNEYMDAVETGEDVGAAKKNLNTAQKKYQALQKQQSDMVGIAGKEEKFVQGRVDNLSKNLNKIGKKQEQVNKQLSDIAQKRAAKMGVIERSKQPQYLLGETDVVPEGAVGKTAVPEQGVDNVVDGTITPKTEPIKPTPAQPNPIEPIAPKTLPSQQKLDDAIIHVGSGPSVSSAAVAKITDFARKVFGTMAEQMGPTLEASTRMWQHYNLNLIKYNTLVGREASAINKTFKKMSEAEKKNVFDMAESFTLVPKGEGDIAAPNNIGKDIKFGARERVSTGEWRVNPEGKEYNPQTAKSMWESASDKERKAALFARSKFDEYGTRFGYYKDRGGSDIEAYVPWMYENNYQNNVFGKGGGKRLLKEPTPPRSKKARTGAGKQDKIRDIQKVMTAYIDDNARYQLDMATGADVEREFAASMSKEDYIALNSAGGESIDVPKGWTRHTVQFLPKDHPLYGTDILVPNVVKRYTGTTIIKNGGDDQISEFMAAAGDVGEIVSALWKANMIGFNVKTPFNNIIGGAYQLMRGSSEKIFSDATDVLWSGKLVGASEQRKRAVEDMLNIFFAVPRSAKDMVLDIIGKGDKAGILEASIGKRLFDDLVQMSTDAGWKNKAEAFMRVATVLQRHSENLIARSTLYMQDGSRIKTAIDNVIDGKMMGLSDEAIRADEERLMTAFIEADRIRYNYANNPKILDGAVKKAIPFVNFIYHSLRLETGAIPWHGAIKNLSNTRDVNEFSRLFKSVIEEQEKLAPEFNNANAYRLYNDLRHKATAGTKLTPSEQKWYDEFLRRSVRVNLSKALSGILSVGGMAYVYQWRKEADPTNSWSNAPGGVEYEVEVEPTRIYAGQKEGTAKYYKISQFNPWFWMESKLAQKAYLAAVGKSHGDILPEYKDLVNEMISYGPVFEAVALAAGYGTEYTQSKSAGERLGAMASTYVPATRGLEPLAKLYEQATQPEEFDQFGRVEYRRQSFAGQATKTIPILSKQFAGAPKVEPSGAPKVARPFSASTVFFTEKYVKVKEREAALTKAAPREIAKEFRRNLLDVNFQSREDIPRLMKEFNMVDNHIDAISGRNGIVVPDGKIRSDIKREMRGEIKDKISQLRSASRALKKHQRSK